MAKSKGLNPAEAHRKNQRKKEVQKNKEARKKTRELQTAKQDTGPIEEEIEAIEAKPVLSGEDKGKLSSLRAELKRLLKAKEEYLKEHPEHRSLVYASAHKRQRGEAASTSRLGDPTDRKVFGKDGLPLHPERSIYYDPVMNPYGIPPPGMLYMERPATPDENQMVYAPNIDESSSEEDDDDIPMPPGPPPGGYSDDSSDEDGNVAIPPPALPPGFVPPLPPGPPPPNAVLASGFTQPVLYPHPGLPNVAFPSPPPPPLGAPIGAFPVPPPPPPPLGFSPAFPLNMPAPYMSANLPPGAIPPPPFGFPNFPPNFPPQPPPLQKLPRNFQRGAPGPHFDLLSIPGAAVSQSYQAYHHPTPAVTYASPTVGVPSSLPKRPSDTVLPKASTNAPLALDDTSGAATIFAAPELRDLKKEATAFVPRGIRQKALVASAGPRVNAAPASATGGSPGAMEEEEQRPDLMKALAKAGITGASAGAPVSAAPGLPIQSGQEAPRDAGNEEQREEYERFMDDIGDLLK